MNSETHDPKTHNRPLPTPEVLAQLAATIWTGSPDMGAQQVAKALDLWNACHDLLEAQKSKPDDAAAKAKHKP